MFEPIAVFVDDEPHTLSTITRSLRAQPVRAFYRARSRDGIGVAGTDAILREGGKGGP